MVNSAIKNWQIAALLFLLALTLRAPFFWYPPKIVFDEGVNAAFATKIVHREPYFDVHPPLAHMLFALAAGPHKKPQKTLHDIGGSFDTFPYIRARALNVFFGTMLAPIIFLISALLLKNRAYALLSGFFVAFDNALILYSRHILPDTSLLLFGLLAVFLFLISLERGWFFLVPAGIFFGAAASVKWIGLGFMAPVLLYLIFKKRARSAVAIVLIAVFVYVAVFHVFFSRFGGGVVPGPSQYAYPKSESVADTALFLPKHTKTMFLANFKIPEHPYAANPALWPFGQKFIWFWSDGEARIGLVPNLFSWWLMYLGVILLAVKYGSQTSVFLILLFAFAIQYLPFFAILRPLFVYHYFSALLAGYVLLPAAIKEGAQILAPRVSFEKAARWVAVVVVVSWVLVSIVTYGFPV